MPKKCIICEKKPPAYRIRNTNEVYCRECAQKSFSDLSCLEKIMDRKSKVEFSINEHIP